jgi:hypothetical protein
LRGREADISLGSLPPCRIVYILWYKYVQGTTGVKIRIFTFVVESKVHCFLRVQNTLLTM